MNRNIENLSGAQSLDRDILALKATSNAILATLDQCASIIRYGQGVSRYNDGKGETYGSTDSLNPLNLQAPAGAVGMLSVPSMAQKQSPSSKRIEVAEDALK